MAGEWIKMRNDLAEDPAVIAMAAALDVEEDLVVGKLHRLWSWADRQSRDGSVAKVTGSWVDRHLRRDGFAAAMIATGWLQIGQAGISFPNFDRHNGQTAKTRALNSNVQRGRRVTSLHDNDSDTAESRDKVTLSRTLRRHVYKRDGGCCRYCGWMPGEAAPTGDYVGATLSLDHVIPESRGGETTFENLVTACSVCNGRKNGRTPTEAGMKLSPVNVSRDSNDAGMTREEKRREEKKEQDQKLSPTAQEPASPTPSLKLVPDAPKPEQEARIVETVLSAYHETLPLCRQMHVVTPKQRKKILAADKLAGQVCKQQGWSTMKRRDFWLAYFGECLEDPWLRGELPNPNNPRWKQNLLVLIDEERFAEIMDRAIAKGREGAA